MSNSVLYTPSQPYPWAQRLYAMCLYALLPVIPVYLLLRGRKQPEYRRHWGERFACYRGTRVAPQARRVWLHAVSLGETRATAPLVHTFFERQPDAHIILTHTTPTGRAAGQEIFEQYLKDGRMTQVYVPYDLNPLLNRFFHTFQPTDVWVMETEVWPNLMAQCVRRHIPASLINGRMSEKTLRTTLKWRQLMSGAYSGFTHICAQTELDARRYLQIGVKEAQLKTTGNLKFDIRMSPEQISKGEYIRTSLGTKPVMLLASSRDGEEQQWLDAYLQHSTDDMIQNTQWWIVPRHPQRFDEVMRLLSRLGKTVFRKSTLDGLPPSEQIASLQAADIVLGDTMGEMFFYYAVADVVLMGGTWLPYGGQNFLEPLALGKMVLIGRSTYNFEYIAAQALANRVLNVFDNLDQAMTYLTQNHQHSQHHNNQTKIQQRIQFIQNACGAADKVLSVVL